jgi:glycosyltransferase involved in cell wall biosynthesis
MKFRRKEILIVSLNPPYPLTHGGAIAQYYFLEKLSLNHKITYLAVTSCRVETSNLKKLQIDLPQLEVIIWSSNGLSRVLVFMRFVFRMIVGAMLSRDGRKLKSDDFNSPKIGLGFRLYLSVHFLFHKYDVVQCEFYETLNLLPFLPKNSLKVFVHHEIRFKRLISEVSVWPNTYIDQVRSYELEMLNRVDRIIVFNDDDKRLLLLSGASPSIHVSTFGIPDRLIIKKEFSSTFNKYIFLGSEDHPPNSEGVVRFLNDIFIPHYEKMVPLYICGNWTAEFRKLYIDFDKIVFTGFVSDLSVLFENAVMIAPIWSGSGLRTKILQAMANKIPVVTTEFAAEGLYDSHDKDHFLFFCGPKDFVNCLVPDDIMMEKVILAFEYYEQRFSSPIVLSRRAKVYYD